MEEKKAFYDVFSLVTSLALLPFPPLRLLTTTGGHYRNNSADAAGIGTKKGLITLPGDHGDYCVGKKRLL